MTAATEPAQRVHVVGAGLIGASIGLSLTSQGVDVTLEDRDVSSADIAASREAGTARQDGWRDADLVVLAVPTAHVVPELQRLMRLNLNATFTDVASVKVHVMREAETARVDLSRFIPGHPIAGRERGGPLNARADLFQGRSWALTPAGEAAPSRVQMVERLITACGARPVRLTPEEHDAAMALVSHVPQVVASVLAGELVDAPFDVGLMAGQGLRDSTRIAESDPKLWAEIIAANATEIAPIVERLRARLDEVGSALRSSDPAAAIASVVARGQEGRARVGATHGGPAVAQDVVSVLLRDTPGELARIFDALGEAGINVGDVRIDHAPGEAVGVLELTVARDSGAAAVTALRSWRSRVSTSTGPQVD